LYRFVDAAVVRAAVCLPGAVPPWPDLTGDTEEHVTQWCRWLQQVWATAGFAASVEVASPTLARRIWEMCDGYRLPTRQVRRVTISVIRYLLRMTSRATPFGLFSGVAPVGLGSAPKIWFGENHRAVARIDAGWLDGVITRLENSRELWHRLLVVRNNLAFVRDGRLVVGCQQQAGAARGAESAEVSVRYTEAVRIVLQAAAAPIRLGELAGKLAAEFPDRPDVVINGMLAGLVAQRMLVTNLRPPMTAIDPLAHVVNALAAVGADAVPEVVGLLNELHDIHADLARHNAASPTQARNLRARAFRGMATIVTAERPVAVDLRLDGGLVLPPAVVREAENTAAALVRLTPHPFGPPRWQEYHRRFCERYGLGALVGVHDLLDVDSGLGFPAGYRDSRLNHPATPGLTERDVALLALAQNAALRQQTDVVLDDTMIANLSAGAVDKIQPQPHTELRCRIYAPSTEALSRGEFQLAITGVSRAAGTTTGRFLDLLDAADRDRMFHAYAALPTVSEDAVRVQVSGPALYPRADNIARCPAVLPHLLSLAEHHSGNTGIIPLDDLAVSADSERLYLISLSRQRPVEPTVLSAVELTNHAHPLLRFLVEIATARTAACVPFTWGEAGRLPFLPRIRYRRSILCPAMWTLTATDLPGAAATWQEWVDSLVAWRDQCRVPASVYLGDGDRRIRLDLAEPAHLTVLRTDLERNGHATVREAPDASALGWIDGRAHDIVIPLAAAQPAAPGPARLDRVLSREHGHLPGSSEWLYVKLYGHPDRQTAILTTHLSTLLSTWDNEPDWWFLRYHDPEKHLRLRIRLRDAGDFGPVAARIAEWTAGLRRLGLVGQVQWDTYYPETGRFGRDAAMAAAESVFAADSAAVIAQLQATNHRGPHPHAVIAASMVDLAITVTGSISNGMRWLISHLRTPSIPAPPREVHHQAIRLANPHNDWAALRAIPGGDDIAASWTLRRTALARYRDALATEDQFPPDAVLADLLHLHHARMSGISTDTEWACRRLARAAALSWTARTQGAP
jgi:thiopeptide-type bacteriocin biosynthesis protein